MTNLEASIVAAQRALPEAIRSTPATDEELVAFESEFGPIPVSYRWYLQNCGGGVAGSEWLDDIRQLAATHRKFKEESAVKGGWTMRDVFVIGWDGAGNPFGIRTATGEVVVEDHNFGGVHVLAPSFKHFLANGLGVTATEP